MFTIFSNIIENALKNGHQWKQFSFETVEVTSPVNKNGWQETRKCKQINSRMNPKVMKCQSLQNFCVQKFSASFLGSQIFSFNNLPKDKDEWNFINEARKTRRTKTILSCFKISFGDSFADQKRIAYLLNYRYSKLGECFDLNKPSIDQSCDEISLNNKTLRFRSISRYESRKYFESLNINKPLGPDEIPAWALKDSRNLSVEPLCYLINAFRKKESSLTI